MNVKIERLPPFRVATVRAYGPYERSGPEAWQMLTPWIARHSILTGRTMFLGFCHDDPNTTESSRIRYDAGVTLPEEFVPDDFVFVREVPGQEYAVTVHKGPYPTLTHVWATLFWDWLPASSRRPAASPLMEQYLSDPYLDNDEDLVTRLYLPLITL